jgi:hypothetical protein
MTSVPCVLALALWSQDFYPLNPDKAPEYIFSISDTSETITCMETSPQKGAPIFAPSTSETIPENVLFTPAGPSTSMVDTSWTSDTLSDEIIPSKLLM